MFFSTTNRRWSDVLFSAIKSDVFKEQACDIPVLQLKKIWLSGDGKVVFSEKVSVIVSFFEFLMDKVTTYSILGIGTISYSS